MYMNRVPVSVLHYYIEFHYIVFCAVALGDFSGNTAVLIKFLAIMQCPELPNVPLYKENNLFYSLQWLPHIITVDCHGMQMIMVMK